MNSTTNAIETDLPNLTNEQVNRYKRHLILPEVGAEGQKKLLNAKVLCIGAGGLGCPIALYLAAAGVGTIGLADIDVVSPSNLQRQILFGTKSIGEDKVKAAADRLRDLNPDVKLIEHKTIVNSSNVMELIADYDIVIDGTDNFPTRYCVGDACVLQKKPNVYGSIFRFEGMVTVFAPHLPNPLRPGEHGPCYRCMYPEPPDPGSVPSCAEGGVLGVLPGIIGTLARANEVIKLILGVGHARDRQVDDVRRDGSGVQNVQAAGRPDVPGLRDDSDDHRADRLRAVLRRARARSEVPRRDRGRGEADQGRRRRQARPDARQPRPAAGVRLRRAVGNYASRREGQAGPARGLRLHRLPAAERVRDHEHPRRDVAAAAAGCRSGSRK